MAKMMSKKNLESLAQANGMIMSGKSMYGVKDGYHICTKMVQNGYVQMFAFRFSLAGLTEENKKTIKKFVKESRRTLKLGNVQFEGNVVMIILNAVVTKKMVFEDALYGIISFFKENHFVSGCSFADISEDINFVVFKGQVMAISDAVVDRIKSEESQNGVDNEDKGYTSGILGACIGGVIGMIPWVLFAMIGYVSAIRGLVMGWLTKTGYEKLNGKKGKFHFPILVVVIIIFTYLGIMASQTYFEIQYFLNAGYRLSDIRILNLFKLVIALPFTPEGQSTGIWFQVMQGFFFAALGSIGFLSKASKEKEFVVGSKIDTNIPQPIEGTTF